jgi:hypothetical protein
MPSGHSGENLSMYLLDRFAATLESGTNATESLTAPAEQQVYRGPVPLVGLTA